jgi:pimeloyl-ACP methyl ester carboxylesterase
MMTRLVPCAVALALALAFGQPAFTQQAIDQPPPAPLGRLVAGSFSIDGALVQPEIAKMTRVCSYDRAGYGWSDPGPEWDTVEQVTHDLDAVLKNGGEQASYVLVGQSVAGLFVLWYHHEHPDQVAGIVLVDHRAIGAPVNGKVVPIWTLSREQLQATLPPPSSLKKPPLPAEVHPPFDKLPANLKPTHVWLERHFFETGTSTKDPR